MTAKPDDRVRQEVDGDYEGFFSVVTCSVCGFNHHIEGGLWTANAGREPMTDQGLRFPRGEGRSSSALARIAASCPDSVHANCMHGGGTAFTQGVRPYSPGEVFMPTCPIQRCAASCEPDALYCSECGARLYTIESGRYGKQS